MSNPVQFWFDFSSPYSYIANEWIDELCAKHGRRVTRNAILLGATFQAAELKSPVSYPLKREYSLRDFARSARAESLKFVMPAHFPLGTQNAARVFWWLNDTVSEKAAADWTRQVFHAVFTRNLVISDGLVLRQLCTDSGLDADAAEAVWQDPRWKARLKAECDSAIAIGMFGAPWIVIDGEPFWGNDRKTQIERWLAEGPF